jgi:hypothetical protein
MSAPRTPKPVDAADAMTTQGDDHLQCTLCHYWFMPAKRVPFAERKHLWHCSYCQRGVDPPQRVDQQAADDAADDIEQIKHDVWKSTLDDDDAPTI